MARNLTANDFNSFLKESMRKVEREIEESILKLEFSNIEKSVRRKTLRDLYNVLESVRSIRPLETPTEPLESYEEWKSRKQEKKNRILQRRANGADK